MAKDFKPGDKIVVLLGKDGWRAEWHPQSGGMVGASASYPTPEEAVAALTKG